MKLQQFLTVLKAYHDQLLNVHVDSLIEEMKAPVLLEISFVWFVNMPDCCIIPEKGERCKRVQGAH